MTSIDISTLFGTALDNAIEASKEIADPSRRLIRLALFAHEHFTVICIENYFVTTLRWKGNGDLASTKSSKGLHGYSVKSVRHIAHEHQGEVSIDVISNWFTLNILLPQKNEKLTRWSE
ncbi:ATP-binding protein [Bifidobacterium sp. H1HS10N]|uniref:ATP-binding protein n=1 Tax=Bifidobacterium kimbladii TaxID=1293826 RepID=UPI0028BDC3ED|nr:ATP-binding protein [Bifidobacterium sp. H1HS10N]MDT7513335.1 ATP-binding protein [Bifidobacterium sp. H1HS10N]